MSNSEQLLLDQIKPTIEKMCKDLTVAKPTDVVKHYL